MALLDNDEYQSDLYDLALSGARIARKWNVYKSTVNKHRIRLGIKYVPTTGTPDTATPSGDTEETTSDGVIVNASKMSESPWGLDEWRTYLRQKGQNPDEVTFTYGVTSNPQGGFWNKLNNVKRKGDAAASIDWEAARKFVEGFTYVPAKRDFLVDVSVLQPTDEQWGKTDFDGGTPETEERVLNSYSRFVDYIREYRPRKVLLARTGDGIENTCSTNSQRDTNDLDVPHMLVQLHRIDLVSLKMIAPEVETVVDARVPSNHGRWRTSLKSDAGNPHADFGIAVGRMLEDTQRELGVFPTVQFVFPDKLMESMTVDLGPVKVGLVHGHQTNSPDRIGEWWAKQDHGRMPTWDADVLLAGHFHSFRTYQSGDRRWVMVGPASDPGSSWFSNLQGERATSGMHAVSFEGKRWRFQDIL